IRRAAGRIQNLGIETNVKTTSTSADGKRVCLLGVEVRNTLEVNNCYFDGDINFVAGTFRAHTGLIDNAKYNNCVFDINLLANGEDVAATSSNYAYLRLSPANSGTPTFTNCAYIVNDTNTSAASANTSKITNATVCADLNTFISAFKANEVTNQSTYTAWSVDANDKLYLVGTQIA
ncbi:MAG: hypothetical protein IKC83_03620, partial [Clostridia bacterium]|nr:hypothetical protein [Clostridia bacterium]